MNHSSRKSNRDPPDRVRVDKWLWAARFFKTRSLASSAIKGGKIDIDGHKAKPSSAVQAKQRLRISKGQTTFEVDVAEVSEQRGPADRARRLYIETRASIERRAAQAAERRAARLTMPRPASRPDKRQRRQLRRFKHGD